VSRRPVVSLPLNRPVRDSRILRRTTSERVTRRVCEKSRVSGWGLTSPPPSMHCTRPTPGNAYCRPKSSRQVAGHHLNLIVSATKKGGRPGAYELEHDVDANHGSS